MKKVLIINSYHQGFKWTDSQVSAALEVLSQRLDNLELFVEYMDTKRLYTEAYLTSLKNIYHLKYGNIHLDAVITTDDNALDFVLRHHEQIFNRAPVSFSGINNYRKALIDKNPDVTGVVEFLDIKATIDLVLNLHPHVCRIAVVTDNTPTGEGQLKAVKKAASGYTQIEFEYFSGEFLSHEELFSTLASLEKNTIVLLTVWLMDRNNFFMSAQKACEMISLKAPVPVYGLVDLFFGHGIVGGKLLNSEIHGRMAAEKALRIIAGEPPSTIPVDYDNSIVNPYMFDYEQLEKWKINLSDLPENSVVINRPLSVFREFMPYIYMAVSIGIFLVIMILFLVLNILRRQRAEEELRKSEEKFRNSFYHHSAVKLMFDPADGRIVEANTAAENFYGWSLAEIRTMRIQDINILSEDQVTKEMENAMTRRQNKFEFCHRLADGTIRDVEVYSSGIEFKGRGVLLSIIHDVTERRKAEKALKESEKRFRNIFNLSPQPIALTEVKTGKIIACNKKLGEWTGYRLEEFYGKTTTEIGLYSEEQRRVFLRELETHGQVDGLEMTFKARDGSALIGLMFASMLKLDEKDLILTILNDITGQKEIENRLQQSQKLEAIGSLAGGIAHDFNNLLFPIIAYSELMLEDFSRNSQEYKNIKEIYNAGKRGGELVKQILAFSRQSDQQLLPVHVQHILKEILKLGRRTIPVDIEIVEDIQKDCGPVMADPTQIHQIAMNLVTNAYHAVESKSGKISVQLREVLVDDADKGGNSLEPGKYAVLKVSDTGAGIEQGVINKIFDPYFTTKEKGKGTGLGLSTVYGIVKKYNGEVTVSSELGQGSVFSVFLPLAEKSMTYAPKKEALMLPRGTENILLVDDEPPVAHLERQMLERLNYKVTIQTGSVEALAVLTADPFAFDLIITDMNMPNLTGDQLTRKVLEIRPDIPVIICTGFSERMNKEKAEIIGIKGFLLKPVVIQDMAEMVRNVLDASKNIKA